MCGVPAGRFPQRGHFNAMRAWMMLATQRCLRCCETYMGFHQCKALNRICYFCRQYGHISASELCPNRKNATVPVRPADNQQPSSSPGPVEGPKEEPVEPVCAALDMPFSGLTDEDFSDHVPDSRQFTEVKQQMSLQRQVIKHKKIIKDLNLTAENLNKRIEFLQQENQHLVDFIIDLDQFCIGSFLETTTIISEYETAIEDLCETFGKKLRRWQQHKCGRCGLFIRHQLKDCPAQDNTCSRCNKENHFTYMCSRPTDVPTLTMDANALQWIRNRVMFDPVHKISELKVIYNAIESDDTQTLTIKSTVFQ